MTDDLTDIDYNICVMAIVKCDLLFRAVKYGLPCTLTKKNFGFPDLSEDETSELIQKLRESSEIAWLRNQPKEIL